MDNQQLQKLYGQLKGMKDFVYSQSILDKSTGDDYNQVVAEIAKITEQKMDQFLLPHNFYYQGNQASFCREQIIRSKLSQFISYLEHGYHLSESVIEIGSIYNSITDEELKSRCSDILSAPGNFDRVINQATLVLEDRIRTKGKLERSLIGANLVNKAIHGDLSKTILKISDVPEIQEGVGHICRGIMFAYRNPTHHTLTDCSREEALKVCAFVDTMLQLIDQSKKVNS